MMMIRRGPPTQERASKSIAEFCRDYGISRGTFARWQQTGVGPAVTRPVPGGRVLITSEAEAAWKGAHTALTAAE
jgi:hypothetical protein